jgi:CHRD domain
MKLRKLVIAVASTAVFAVGLWAGIGSAGWFGGEQAMGLRATLGVAAEVPEPKGVRSNARGTFTAGLTRRGTRGTLTWRLTFRGLTGSATAAHVHLGKVGVAGPVMVPLCGPCRSGARGTSRVNGRVMSSMLGRGAYVNVHTKRNPAGEIRGQVRRGGSAPSGTTGTTTTDTTTTTTTYESYP